MHQSRHCVAPVTVVTFLNSLVNVISVLVVLAVFVVLRVIWAAANVALVGLLRTGNIQSAARMVWQGIVTLSREQKRRARSPRKRS